MSELSKKHCVPCEGGATPFGLDTSTQYLEELDRWHLTDDVSIEKVVQWKDFKEALNFVNKVGALAEQEGHHPDISIFEWNKVRILLTTHAIGGLSDNDFILASKIDELLTSRI